MPAIYLVHRDTSPFRPVCYEFVLILTSCRVDRHVSNTHGPAQAYKYVYDNIQLTCLFTHLHGNPGIGSPFFSLSFRKAAFRKHKAIHADSSVYLDTIFAISKRRKEK
jgi:hypothetical protein